MTLLGHLPGVNLNTSYVKVQRLIERRDLISLTKFKYILC